MRQYLDLAQHVLDAGTERHDRTGVGTIGLFGYQMRFNLQEGFPLLTTKKLHWRSIAHELLWFVRGETNIAYLHENGVTIWDEWADENGDLGPIYGHQWRSWATNNGQGHIDQLKGALELIKTDPQSRRIIVSAWNVSQLDEMALPPCHLLFQFHVANGKLSCHLYQRSADIFLGVPFNIASYALLTHLIAQDTGLAVGDLIISLGDAHIYTNHIEAIELQLTREPRKLPTLQFHSPRKSLFDYRFEDFSIIDYHPHPHIPGKVAV